MRGVVANAARASASAVSSSPASACCTALVLFEPLLVGPGIVCRLDFSGQQRLARVLDAASFCFERGETFGKDCFGVRFELSRLPRQRGLCLQRVRGVAGGLRVPASASAAASLSARTASAAA